MATVNFYDTPLSEVSCSKKIKKGLTVETVVNEYLESKTDTSETYEVYNIETGETTYEKVTPDKYKVAVVVNGEDKGLDYKLKSKDIVSIIFVPEANSTGGDWFTIIESALMLTLGIILACTPATAQLGVPLIIGGAAGLLAGVFSAITRQDEQKNNTDKLETEAALVINGAENQVIGENNFPFVFGKIAENPPIVGSPYHETFTDADGKFNCQYMSALYCFGYGPLNLTDFKIGETALCFNRPRDVDGERDNLTIFHGFIDSHTRATTFEQSVADSMGYYTYNSSKKAYVRCDVQPTADNFNSGVYFKLNYVIPQKWKNNDVTMEILQRGLLGEENVNIEELHGTIYNKTIIEDEVNANLLFIHDEDLREAAEKQYKGVAIPEGYRTNTVRLSQECPSHLEVELDFSSSIYRNRSEKSGNTSYQRYYDIPIRYAVQWRPIYKNNKVSDAEDGSGWRSFDYLQLGDKADGHWQSPKPYTASDALLDMSLNAGANFSGSDRYNQAMYDFAYDKYYAGYYSTAYVKTSADAAYARPTSSGTYYTNEERNSIASQNASAEAIQKVKEWADISNVKNVYEMIEEDTEGKYIKATYNPKWVGTDVFCINKGKSFTTSHAPDNFDGNERLYVFSKDLTPEEAQLVLNSDSDKVEIRVIRITPNYIDEAGTNSTTHGDFSYQDLGVWKYLRTTCFDKDQYKEAIKENPNKNAKDYPRRPIKNEDLKKFAYVAIRLKQDVAETGGSSLKQVRAVANSLSPVYDPVEKKWNPETINKKTNYYQKVQTSDGWKVNKLENYDEYISKKLAGESNLYKQESGNDYVQQIAADIFTDANVVETTPIKKYKFTETLQKKYTNTNTASSVLLAMVGPQNGDLAKTYDDINMTSATELFNFCEDVVDGSTDKDTGEIIHIKYSCNGVISNPTKPDDLIKQMLITGRSILKRDDENRYEFFIGREQKYVMNVLNSKNVISETNTRTFEDVPSGFMSVFPDEADDYTQNPVYCMDRGEDWRNPTKPMEQISISYVTNANQMWSLMCFNLAGRLFQRETYTRTVGKMGLSLSIGDVMLLQGDSLIVGTDKGGRIVEVIENNGKIYGFTSNEPFNYTGETETDSNGRKRSTQGVTIVQPNKYGASRCVTLRLAPPEGNGYITADSMAIGLTNIVALENPITVSEDGNYSKDSINENGEFVTLDPKEGDLLAFGLISKITEKAQIVSIKPNGGKFALNLVPYSDDYYMYGKKLPEFTPKMTINREVDTPYEFTPYATKSDIAESKSTSDENKRDLSVDSNVETTITTCYASRDGIQLICETRKNGTPVAPMSVVWRFYREDIVNEYSLPSVSPIAANFGDRDYYTKEGDVYTKQTVFDPTATYYVYPSVVDTFLFEEESVEQSYAHIFDRARSVASCNGYPEYYDLYPIKVTATAKLTVSSKTPESVFSRVGVQDYGTWIPSTPVILTTVQDRSAILSFSQNRTGKTIYGVDSLVYEVQIRKDHEGTEDLFTKPDLATSPYPKYNNIGNLTKGNESAYRIFKEAYPTTQEEINKGIYFEFADTITIDGNTVPYKDYVKATIYVAGTSYYTEDLGAAESASSFSQILPLEGQSHNDSKGTIYEYKVRARSITGAYSDYETAKIEALVTNLRDIVKANATAKSEYVENLAAISAKLGDISEGSLTGDDLNYWTLSTKDNAQESDWNRDFQGAFRVGNEQYFLQVIPKNIDPVTKKPKDAEVKFSMGNFEVASKATKLNNIVYLYDDNDFTDHGLGGINFYTKRLYLTYRGMEMQVNNGDGDNPDWHSVGRVSIDEMNNMFITNAELGDNDVPKIGITVTDASIYHFDNNLNDEQGGNSSNLTFDGGITEDNAPVVNDSSVFSGSLKKDFSEERNIMFFVKEGKLVIGDDFISVKNGNVHDFNSLDRSLWGESTLPEKLFKI